MKNNINFLLSIGIIFIIGVIGFLGITQSTGFTSNECTILYKGQEGNGKIQICWPDPNSPPQQGKAVWYDTGMTYTPPTTNMGLNDGSVTSPCSNGATLTFSADSSGKATFLFTAITDSKTVITESVVIKDGSRIGKQTSNPAFIFSLDSSSNSYHIERIDQTKVSFTDSNSKSGTADFEVKRDCYVKVNSYVPPTSSSSSTSTSSTPSTSTSSSSSSSSSPSSSQCTSTMDSQQALQECTKGTQGYFNNHIMNCNSCVGSSCHWSAGPSCGSSGGGSESAGCGSAANAGPSCQGSVPTPGQEDTPAPASNEIASRGPPQVKLATTSTTLDSNLLAIASACQDGNTQTLNALGRQQLGLDFDISTKALIFNV